MAIGQGEGVHRGLAPDCAVAQETVTHREYPHLLRHNAAAEPRKEFGIEAARIILGHRSAAVTEIYAERDEQEAIKAVMKVGQSDTFHLRRIWTSPHVQPRRHASGDVISARISTAYQVAPDPSSRWNVAVSTMAVVGELSGSPMTANSRCISSSGSQ